MGHTMELNQDGEPHRGGPPVDPLLGRLLLHYRVIEVIGQGGMSVVYRGRDEHLARDVAIKVLHPFLREKPECRTRLAREARAVARLEHAHIVKVFDFSGDRPTLNEKKDDGRAGFGHWPDEGFIVAELVKGGTLKRHAEKSGLWAVPEIGAMVVWQLALALQHAHDNGVVHRDLKPENVMVRDDGVLKLMDFGIAQIADQGGLTVTGTLLGSPAHMAPECIDGHPADERSDLFSLGTVLYWITTGALPFEALTPHALLKLIVDGKAAPAQQKSSKVSDDLARVIHKSLATKPSDRYASAREMAAALEDVLEKSGLPADPVLLRDALASPSNELPKCAARVRAAFLERAQKALDEGATARALGCLNRVLADDAADKDARALLDRLDVDDTAPVADDAALRAAIDGKDNNDLSSGEVTDPGAITLSPQPSTTNSLAPSSPLWPRIFVAATALALVVAAVAIANAVDEVATPTPPNSTPPLPEASNDIDGVTRGSPDFASDDDDDDRGPRRKKKTDRKLLPTTVLTPMLTTPVFTPTTTTPATPTGTQGERRKVTFRATPWADIVIDGVVVAHDKYGPFDADLGYGDHVVVFKNPQAKEHAQRFTVTKEGPLEVSARLEPKPANLSVRCNVGDAFVVVGGDKGTGKPATESLERPLVVVLGKDSKVEREVFVYKEGFVPYRRRHLFLAGETTSVDVVLEPDGVEGEKQTPKKNAPPVLGGPPTP